MKMSYTFSIEENQRELMAAVAEVCRLLQRSEETYNAERPRPPALERLCQAFGLSVFERDILLLCAGMELDSSVSGACATAQGSVSQPWPTFSLALSRLREPHWSALTPASPLRRWRLIELQEIGTGTTLLCTPLRIAERVLHFLTGIQYIDERLAPMVGRVEPSQVVPSHQAVAAEATRALQSRGTPIVQLFGCDAASRQRIAAQACASLSLALYVLDAENAPIATQDLDAFVHLWQREAVLSGCALYVETELVDRNDAKAVAHLLRLVESISGVLIVGSRDTWRPAQRSAVWLEVCKPTACEQREAWTSALGPVATTLNGSLGRVVSHFNLTLPAIHASAQQALAHGPDAPIEQTLWDAAREQARPRLDDLAERIVSSATWEDLVLPDVTKQSLHEIAAQVVQRDKVYQSWGFGGVSPRGLGVSAMFAGSSGTGKTMAAEVLANALRLDLYRIDLSSVVSKYIGETEKNLRRVFDAAEDGGTILFFDEADALFGKRSEVKDSHDRFANIEVSYLLQRMECYRGLAILATNMRGTVDSAFLRRIRFIINFPFPDAALRAEIWKRVFPDRAPTQDLNHARLARLNIAGGNIRSIAVNAAFLAADSGVPVNMAHILRSARSEYAKLDKPLSDAETGDWR